VGQGGIANDGEGEYDDFEEEFSLGILKNGNAVLAHQFCSGVEQGRRPY
jgi:hypothetical protein